MTRPTFRPGDDGKGRDVDDDDLKGNPMIAWTVGVVVLAVVALVLILALS